MAHMRWQKQEMLHFYGLPLRNRKNRRNVFSFGSLRRHGCLKIQHLSATDQCFTILRCWMPNSGRNSNVCRQPSGLGLSFHNLYQVRSSRYGSPLHPATESNQSFAENRSVRIVLHVDQKDIRILHFSYTSFPCLRYLHGLLFRFYSKICL